MKNLPKTAIAIGMALAGAAGAARADVITDWNEKALAGRSALRCVVYC